MTQPDEAEDLWVLRVNPLSESLARSASRALKNDGVQGVELSGWIQVDLAEESNGTQSHQLVAPPGEVSTGEQLTIDDALKVGLILPAMGETQPPIEQLVVTSLIKEADGWTAHYDSPSTDQITSRTTDIERLIEVGKFINFSPFRFLKGDHACLTLNNDGNGNLMLFGSKIATDQSWVAGTFASIPVEPCDPSTLYANCDLRFPNHKGTKDASYAVVSSETAVGLRLEFAEDKDPIDGRRVERLENGWVFTSKTGDLWSDNAEGSWVVTTGAPADPSGISALYRELFPQLPSDPFTPVDAVIADESTLVLKNQAQEAEVSIGFQSVLLDGHAGDTVTVPAALAEAIIELAGRSVTGMKFAFSGNIAYSVQSESGLLFELAGRP